MADTCVQSLIVINTAINQLESKVSLKTMYCLRLFVVVYKHNNVVASYVMVADTCVPNLIVIDTTIKQLQTIIIVSLITILLPEAFVVYKHEKFCFTIIIFHILCKKNTYFW